MQSKERTWDERQNRETVIYPFCIHDNCREAESILIAPLEKLQKVKKDVEREAAKLRYLDRRVTEETEKGNRYGATRAATQWWNRLEKLDDYLQEHHIERELARQGQANLVGKDGKKEDLSVEIVEIGFDDDDTDDQEMLWATELTKDEKQYILDESRELRFIDAQIKDDMKAGNQDDVEFWQQQYRGRLESLRWYMDKKGIMYSLDKKKNMTQEQKIACENHEQKCQACRKRHVTVMRSQGQERSRTRGRQRETP